jgi:hypothetical protein
MLELVKRSFLINFDLVGISKDGFVISNSGLGWTLIGGLNTSGS